MPAVVRDEHGTPVAIVTTTELLVQRALQQRGYRVDVGCSDDTRWRRELAPSGDAINEEVAFLGTLGMKYDAQATVRAKRLEACHAILQ